MSLTRIKGLKHFRYYSSFLNDDEKAVLAAIEDYLNGRKDELDLQDAFLDVGYDKAAKF
jgi:alkylhydroperoxidase family enzyme